MWWGWCQVFAVPGCLLRGTPPHRLRKGCSCYLQICQSGSPSDPFTIRTRPSATFLRWKVAARTRATPRWAFQRWGGHGRHPRLPSPTWVPPGPAPIRGVSRPDGRALHAAAFRVPRKGRCRRPYPVDHPLPPGGSAGARRALTSRPAVNAGHTGHPTCAGSCGAGVQPWLVGEGRAGLRMPLLGDSRAELPASRQSFTVLLGLMGINAPGCGAGSQKTCRPWAGGRSVVQRCNTPLFRVAATQVVFDLDSCYAIFQKSWNTV